MTDVKGAARTSRREQAEASRLRMIRAAHAAFVDRGYTGTRMIDVAAAAGVAVQTVYFRFHTKAELLQACYENAVLGQERLPPSSQPWHLELMAAQDGQTALRHFAVGNTAIVERVGVLDDVIRSAAHEPEAVAVRRNSERLRREGYREIVVHLRRSFGLRPGLTTNAATDLLLSLGGTALYRALVVDYGWSVPAYTDWLGKTLADQLLSACR